MKRLLHIFFAVALVTMIAGVAQAQQAAVPAARIAVVDLDLIEREASAVKAIRTQINDIGKRFEAEIGEKQKSITDAQQDLAQQQALLAPESLREKERALRQDVAALQRLSQTRRRQLDQTTGRAMSQFRKVLVNVVGQVATARGATMVLPKRTVMFAIEGIDITATVLAQIDKAVPTITIVEEGSPQ